MKILFPFLVFLSISAIFFIPSESGGGKIRASIGHTFIQDAHKKHFPGSVSTDPLIEIASTGQTLAQSPHLLHISVEIGVTIDFLISL
jgi:hypothetical protein